MLTISSDSSTRYGMKPRKQGMNAVSVSYDGTGPAVAYVDARTLYRNGNNMGCVFTYAGGGSCAVAATGVPISDDHTLAQKAAYPWATVGNVTPGASVNDAPNVRQAVRLTFTGAGTVILTRG